MLKTPTKPLADGILTFCYIFRENKALVKLLLIDFNLLTGNIKNLFDFTAAGVICCVEAVKTLVVLQHNATLAFLSHRLQGRL